MALLLLAVALASAGAGFLGEQHECSEWHSRYEAGLRADEMKNGVPYQITESHALHIAGALPSGCHAPRRVGEGF